jgi:hypothetical protein
MRRTLTRIAFLAIVLASISPMPLFVPFYDRAALDTLFRRYDLPSWHEYGPFLDGVREHTRGGESVAVLVPTPRWEPGYAYAYYRASYVLAGREVLPLMDADGRVHPENLFGAELVAVWHAPPPRTHQKLVWSGHGGALLRR